MNNDERIKILNLIQSISFIEYIGTSNKGDTNFVHFPISKHYIPDKNQRITHQWFYDLLPYNHKHCSPHRPPYEYSISEKAIKLWVCIIDNDVEELELMKACLEFKDL